jgi:hypothetical protein
MGELDGATIVRVVLGEPVWQLRQEQNALAS